MCAVLLAATTYRPHALPHRAAPKTHLGSRSPFSFTNSLHRGKSSLAKPSRPRPPGAANLGEFMYSSNFCMRRTNWALPRASSRKQNLSRVADVCAKCPSRGGTSRPAWRLTNWWSCYARQNLSSTPDPTTSSADPAGKKKESFRGSCISLKELYADHMQICKSFV